jgi:hypothetical protein
MKNVFILIFILLICISQPVFSQFTYGVRIATSSKTAKISEYSTSDASYMLGLGAEFTIPIIGVGLGADVLCASVKRDYTNNTLSSPNLTSRYFSLIVPLNLKYKIGLRVFKIVFSLGPYLEMPLGNKLKNDFNIKDDENCNIYGINTSVGFETMKHFQINIGYYFDTKFNSTTMDKYCDKSKGFYVSLLF